ncbi:hypothetical protein OIU74_005184 [Salix koriyanagi]|uniref:Uncharacterized protein n=1 Tax=Salix koriyanagi TaxID=2511006 RepID=A0A9Q0ZGC7_9ROSI|nr:hypothetical protein OIU74_005184 [Salix koriyanagi]
MGKAKVGLVALQLQSAADHDVSVLGRFGSSCIAKEMDGNVLSSSFFLAKENDASLLGKMVARASFTKVGVAPLLLPTTASLSSNGSSSSLSLAKRIGGNVLSFLPPLLRWVPVKEVIPNQATPIEQQSSDEPSRPKTNEEATQPIDYEEPARPNDVQGSSSLNESFDEQRVDPMLLETDVGEWTVVKKRNGKSRVANDNVVSVTSLGDPVCSVGIDVDPLCGVTT